MSNRTLLEEIADDFPRPSTSLGENSTLIHEMENATTHGQPFQVPQLSRFIDDNPWVVYLIVGALTFAVVAITILLLRNVCKNKKRVIQQDDDPVLSRAYDSTAENFLLRVFCCQSADENSGRIRQNSESNMDPYRRPPLPPIGVKQDDFHYISPFSSKGLSEPENISAANINAIRGVSHLPQRAENYRQLPQLKM